MIKLISFFLVAIISFVSAMGQADTLGPGQSFKNWGNLKPQESRSILFTEKNGHLIPLDAIWTRIINIKKEDGENIVSIEQRIEARDSTQNSKKISLLKTNSLQPIHHVSETNGVRITSSFSGNNVDLQLDSIFSNTSKKLTVAIKTEAFDFEADEELFSVLPLKENYKVAIPFYQPGTNRPAKYYVYEVTGSEKIPLPNGNSIDCWKMQSQYTGGISTWWITKENQQVIKQHRARADGSSFYKIRLI